MNTQNKKRWLNLENLPMISVILAVGFWLIFLAKVYFDRQSENVYQPQSIVKTVANDVSPEAFLNEANPANKIDIDVSNVDTKTLKINQLTEKLLEQERVAKELNQAIAQQKIALNDLLGKTVAEGSMGDKEYISSLTNLSKLKSSIGNLAEDKIKNTDYYNRAVIADSGDKNSVQGSLQAKINSIANKVDDKTQIKKSTYAEKLGKESDVRENEMRSIVLKKGESIWMLAKRAYGNGFEYHKIMKANPHITEKNAKFLAPGSIIRVPI